MKNRTWIALVWMAALMALGITAAVASDGEANVSQPHQGVIQIHGYDAEEQAVISLNGEWEFYWKQRLEPEDFRQGSLNPAYLTVPSSWTSGSADVPELDSHGYGTYRLILQVPESDLDKNKSLFLRAIGSAYRLWIDGEEKPGLGTVGSSLAEEQPRSHINLVFFHPKQQAVEIIIQVSNYSFREGGINRAIVYGDTEALIPGILKKLLYDIFVIGGFLMIGLYHLIVYGMRRQDRTLLLVGLVALAISMRTMFINGYLSFELLRIESWESLTRLEYLSEIFGFITLVFLMQSLYPREVHRPMMRLAVWIAVGLFLFIVMTPARIYTESMLLQTILKAAVLFYFIVYVGIKAYLNRREGALIHLAALILIVCALINDTLYYLRMLHTVELLQYSIVPFVLAQAIIVSHRYVRLSRRNASLLEELGAANMQLEQKVADRTRSLQEANERRTKMLANIAHDLGAPLVGIQTYLQLLVRGKLAAESHKMTGQLLDKLLYVKRLVDDLFELSKLESRNMTLEYERVEVRSWMAELHSKFEAELAGEGMVLNKIMTGPAIEEQSWYVRIDKLRMLRVLQNYMDNAVKFSKDMSQVIELRGMIRPDESGSGGELVLELADYGIGLTEAEQAQVFSRFYLNRDNNQSGSGLGLAIAKEIVEQHQGKAGVRSEQGEGSVFYFTLPALQDKP